MTSRIFCLDMMYVYIYKIRIWCSSDCISIIVYKGVKNIFILKKMKNRSKYKWFNNDLKMKAINQPFSFFINTCVRIHLLSIDELWISIISVELPTSITKTWTRNIRNIFILTYKSVNTKKDTIETPNQLKFLKFYTTHGSYFCSTPGDLCKKLIKQFWLVDIYIMEILT